jgi:hypothetical protein
MAHAEPPLIEDEKALARANADLEEKDRLSRQEAAVAMRMEGAPYSDIAATLGYANATQARTAVERCLASLSHSPEDRDHLRFLEARRLERILRGIWKKATQEFITDENGEKIANVEHLAAARTALAVIDRHSRLYGLDAPQELVVYNPTQIELQKWIEKVAGQVRSAGPEEVDIISGEVIDETEDGD